MCKAGWKINSQTDSLLKRIAIRTPHHRDYNTVRMTTDYIVQLHADRDDSQAEQIILCTRWLDSLIEFRVCSFSDPKTTLTGSITLDELKQRAVEFEIPADAFIEETRQCLTRNDGGNAFKYHQRWDNSQSCQFTWKKCTGAVPLTLIYGQVQLRPTDTADSSATGLMGIFEQLQDKNRLIAEENRRLRKDHADLKMCYEQLDKAARETETNLLTKCRLLINEKKIRIKELEEKLMKPTEQPVESQDSETPIGQSFAGKRKHVNRIQSESSQPDESSDDSQPLCFLLPKRKEKHLPKRAALLRNDVMCQDSQQDSPDCNGLFDDL